MTKMNDEKIKMVNGGGELHYHWVCTVNNFWSIKYNNDADARKALQNHLRNYPEHRSKVYVTTCTGNCN